MLINPNIMPLDEQIQQLGERLSESINQESARVTAAGSRDNCWVVRITGKYDYNWYNVEHVDISTPGVVPVPIAATAVPAVNVAESFTAQGNVSPGVYAIMWRVGEANVIDIEP